MTTLTKCQNRDYGPKTYTEDGEKRRITAHVRYDDRCGNGHNTFAITASIDHYAGGRWTDFAGGCLHDSVATHFPHLARFIRWHTVSDDGPMHFISNTVYHAGDRDCYGLRQGESRQIRNGKSGRPSWTLKQSADLPRYVDADSRPTGTATMEYVPWERIGEGHPRDFDAARSCAADPTLTDEQLSLAPPELEALLMSRLPGIMAQFREAVESLGFVY